MVVFISSFISPKKGHVVVKAHRSMAATRKHRYVYVVWAFFENLLLSGVFFGWGTLVYVLKEDGVLSHLCPAQSWTNTTPGGVLSTTTGERRYLSLY